jgi:hypothetical protein
MTEITSINANDWGRHFLRGIMMMTIKKWILPGAMVALLYVAWTALPSGSTAANSAPPLVPALVAGPVGIKGTTPSPSADAPGERAVLMVTNVGDQPVQVRMAIRDATDSRLLVQAQRTLQPGEGVSLTHIERVNLFRSVIGVVSPEPESGPWSVAGGSRSLAASLAGVDDNTTKFVVGANILLTQVGEGSTVGRR